MARSSTSRSQSGRTIFFPARHKELAEIITIRSPKEAREAVRKLAEWADDDVGRVRTAIRAATLAANRALVSTRRKTRPLSPQERKEMLQVAEIYRRQTRRLSEKLEKLEARPARRSRRAHRAEQPSA